VKKWERTKKGGEEHVMDRGRIGGKGKGKRTTQKGGGKGRDCPKILEYIRLRNDLYCVRWGVKLHSLT